MLCHKGYLCTLKLPSLTGKDKYMSTDSILFPQQLQSVMHMLTCPSLKYACRDIPHLVPANPHIHNCSSAFYISRLLSQHFIFRPTYNHISHNIVILIVLQTMLLIYLLTYHFPLISGISYRQVQDEIFRQECSLHSVFSFDEPAKVLMQQCLLTSKVILLYEIYANQR